MEYEHVKFDALREHFSRNTDYDSIDLGYLLREDDEGRINTEMDIQRQYVWNEAREQEMWDSLLLNVRIPEFHAILNGRVRNICDGKQRLTCILRILRNKIPYYSRTAREECKWLFNYAAKPNKKGKLIIPGAIYFCNLPQEIQDSILNKTITIVRYVGLSRIEEIALFKKINYGISLSDFARGMASCFYMRKDFTGPLMQIPVLNQIMNSNHLNDEAIEAILVRALILCSNDGTVNLEPKTLESYYTPFEDEDLVVTWQNRFFKLLQRFPNLNVAFQCRSFKAIVPFILEGVYRHPELTFEQIGRLCGSIIHYSSGRGQNLGPGRVVNERAYIENLILKIKSNEIT